MKRIIAIILSLSLVLSGCSAPKASHNSPAIENESIKVTAVSEELETGNETETASVESGSVISDPAAVNIDFRGLDDEDFLPYVEDTIYSELVDQLDESQYYIENVNAVYISKEYLDEIAYNSLSNIYFGHTAEELEEAFQGRRYVFTLGEDGSTVVKPFEEVSDDTYSEVLKNVAIGTGVILICVTVSVVSAGVGAPAVSVIFATSAKTAATYALSTAAFSGVAATVVTGYQTGDFEEAIKAGTLAASEGFKWGAISGAVVGLGQGITQVQDTKFFAKGTEQAAKYPNGVKFTNGADGVQYPRFERYAKATVKFDMPTAEAAANHTGLTGQYYWDAKLANAAAGFKNTPSGYVWHHVEDMQTMILVPQDLHSIAFGGMPHTGGASLIRAFLAAL